MIETNHDLGMAKTPHDPRNDARTILIPHGSMKDFSLFFWITESRMISPLEFDQNALHNVPIFFIPRYRGEQLMNPCHESTRYLTCLWLKIRSCVQNTVGWGDCSGTPVTCTFSNTLAEEHPESYSQRHFFCWCDRVKEMLRSYTK